MPDWLSILKAYVDTLEAAVGTIEGATTLHNKLTAARAALLDQITALRMAELDPANIPTDLANIIAYVDLIDDAVNGLAAIKAEVEGLAGAAMRGTDGAALAASWTAALATALGNYTAARAGYLDNINQAGLLQLTAARAVLLDQITALRLAELDAANLPADIDTIKGYTDTLEAAVGAIEGATTLHNKLTAARAALLDQITALRMAELDAANIPADVDTVKALVDTAEAVGPYSYLDAGGEQTVYEDAAVTRRHVRVEFSNRNMTQTGTFKLYRKVDGTNYDLWASQAVTVGAGDDRAFDAEFTTNQAWKLTYTESVDEGAARAIPYNVIIQVVE